jgi:Nucleotidyl transferase AbiEii toxin, Type IV TA system
MSADFLHNHAQFPDLIRIVAQQKGIDPALVEKDYWIMHCLYGLQQLGLTFELKGGTSLSKGFQIINRFSEDIDIRIEPPKGHDVKTGRNQHKPAHVKSRRDFYDWLAKSIRIDGIETVERDTAFDNKTLMSAGIRLFYKAADHFDEIPPAAGLGGISDQFHASLLRCLGAAPAARGSGVYRHRRVYRAQGQALPRWRQPHHHRKPSLHASGP